MEFNHKGLTQYLRFYIRMNQKHPPRLKPNSIWDQNKKTLKCILKFKIVGYKREVKPPFYETFNPKRPARLKLIYLMSATSCGLQTWHFVPKPSVENRVL